MKKYRFTGQTMKYDGCILCRIEALIDIPLHNIKAGDLGGWLESEDNLAQSGSCWVDKTSKVYDNARISEDALIYDNAQVFDNAKVSGRAKVGVDSWVYEQAEISGSAEVFMEARVCGSAKIFGHAQIFDGASVKKCELKGFDMAFGERRITNWYTSRRRPENVNPVFIKDPVHN